MPLIIAVTAASWALLHVRYDPVQIGFIALDGVALGAARAHTRSLFVPLAMHVGANLFSISQSLGLWAAP